jgi:hypothetical protein
VQEQRAARGVVGYVGRGGLALRRRERGIEGGGVVEVGLEDAEVGRVGAEPRDVEAPAVGPQAGQARGERKVMGLVVLAEGLRVGR